MDTMPKENLDLIVAFHVDDGMLIGTDEALTKFKREIKRHVNITNQGPVKKLLGAWYAKKRDDQGEYFEIEFANKLVSDYEKEFGKVPLSSTPGFPGETLRKQQELNPVKINRYRSYTGR